MYELCPKNLAKPTKKTVLQFCSSSVSLLILSGSGGFGGPGGGFGGFLLGSRSSGLPLLLLPT